MLWRRVVIHWLCSENSQADRVQIPPAPLSVMTRGHRLDQRLARAENRKFTFIFTFTIAMADLQQIIQSFFSRTIVLFKNVSLKKNAKEFYTHHLKDFSTMLQITLIALWSIRLYITFTPFSFLAKIRALFSTVTHREVLCLETQNSF